MEKLRETSALPRTAAFVSRKVPAFLPYITFTFKRLLPEWLDGAVAKRHWALCGAWAQKWAFKTPAYVETASIVAAI